MTIFVDTRLLTKRRSTGVEEYTRLLVDHLLRLDRKNKYIFFYNGFRKVPFPDAWRKSNVRVIESRIPNKALELSLRLFDFPCAEYFAKCDIYFSPHLNLLHTQNDKKRVIVFHDLSFEYYPEFFPLRKRFWHWEQDVRAEARRAGMVVAVSDFTRATLLEDFGLRAEHVVTIRSGIDLFYKPMEKKDIVRLHSDPFILTVGTLEPRKNIPLAIAAFYHLKERGDIKNLKLVIAGSSGWLSGSIEKEIAASPWRNDIIIQKDVSRDTLRVLYNTARAFLYPSFFEGFGFPPLEAQACGLPVVASNRASLPEILGVSACLVDPWRVEETVEALHALLTDDAFYKQYRILGFENARRFRWEDTAQDFLRLFDQLHAGKETA